jgi:hypothetical protein
MAEVTVTASMVKLWYKVGTKFSERLPKTSKLAISKFVQSCSPGAIISQGVVMNIEIQRAANLGTILYQHLKIDPDSRICVSEIYGNAQIDVWDLATGRYFKISNATTPPTVDQTIVEVPGWLSTIFETSSDDLLAEHAATWEDGASEKRMAIFTELNYRGVRIPLSYESSK